MDAWRRLAAVLLLIAGHLMSVAHAVEHGDQPHDHGGVACKVFVAGDDDTPILPPASLDIAVPAAAPLAVLAPARKRLDVAGAQRRPPPTGPPGLAN